MPGANVRRLSPELLTLAQHVELNKAGWWLKGQCRLIQVCLSTAKRPLSSEEIRGLLASQFGVSARLKVFDDALRVLLKSQIIVAVGADRLNLTDAARLALERDTEAVVRVESQAREAFLAAMAGTGLSPDPSELWERLIDDLIFPLIKSIGASTYRLLNGDSRDYDTVPFRKFLEPFSRDDQEALRKGLRAFFDPGNAAVRGWLLRFLNAYLLLEAGSLPASTLDSLVQRTGGPVTFNLVLDTNALFSILDLHDNPSNDAVAGLLSLLREVSGRVVVKLYVLPTTLEEARRVLVAHRAICADLEVGPSLARATLNQHNGSNILRKFLQRAQMSPERLDAEAYFAPYLDNLLAVLRGKGIELLNTDMSKYGTRQDVVDDIADRKAFLEGRGVQQSYETIRHDVILWHAIDDRRGPNPEDLIHARWWIATVDFSLLKFDELKAKRPHSLPLCLHPVNLVQLLAFWAPRTENYESALLSAFRLPFLFEPYDPGAEQVTVRILRVMSRYEGIDDLSEDTIAHVLMNDELRTRIRDEAQPTRDVEIVESALVKEQRLLEVETKRVREELERERVRAEALDKENAELRARSEELRKLAEEREEEAAAERQARNVDVRTASAARARTEDELRTLRDQLSAVAAADQGRAERSQVRRLRRNAVILRLVAPLVGGSCFGLLLSELLRERLASFGTGWQVSTVAACVLLGLSLGLVRSPSRPEVRDWVVMAVPRKLLLIFWGVWVTGVAVNLSSDFIRSAFKGLLGR